MNKDNSECLSSKVISEYFAKNTVMDDSSDFQEKKKCNTGPKKVQKTKGTSKKVNKRIKGQKDIRSLIKKKNNDLVSYTKNFEQVCKESGVDVDSEQLQLAIALSKSLYDTETKYDALENKPLLSSQERTAKIRITLQEYGFKVASSSTKIAKIDRNQGNRKKIKKQYKLLLVSNEEKQQNIADKYAEVLATNIYKSPLKEKTDLIDTCENYKNIFNKASNILYEHMKNDDIFYVHKLFEKCPFKSLLRDWSEIPGRPISPKKEVNIINFDEISCTQIELDYILSGSINTAQDIIKNKIISNNINISKNISTDQDTEEITIKAIKNLNEELKTDLNVYNDSMDSTINDMLTVSHKVRSVSPDLFDDDISLITDNANNSMKNTQQNITKTYSNAVDFMDLTECVGTACVTNKKKNCINRKNITNSTEDIMEITECVMCESSSTQIYDDKIDLTQCCNINNSKNAINYTDKSPHFNKSCNDKSLVQTIVINDKIEEKPKHIQIVDKESPVFSFNKNKETRNLFDDKKDNINFIGQQIEIDLTQTSHCSDNPACLSSNKRKNISIHETIHIIDTESNTISQHIDSQNNQEIFTNTSLKQLQIDNIDLTQNSFNLNKENGIINSMKGIEIDLTQIYPDELSEVVLDSNSNEQSLDATIILDDIENKLAYRKTLDEDKVLEKGEDEVSEVLLVCDDNKIETKKSETNVSTCDSNKNTVTELLGNNSQISENNLGDANNFSNLKKPSTEINLSQLDNESDKIDLLKENSEEKNVSIDNNDTSPYSSVTKNETTLDDDNNFNCEKVNNPNMCGEDEYQNFYVYDDYVYNNSFNYDYHDNNYSLAEMQNEESKENIIENNPEVPSCSRIYENQNIFSEKDNVTVNNKDSADIDLTQNSDETIESNSKVGKIDNISIDYDEMFDDVMSASSKSVSKTSITSDNMNKNNFAEKLAGISNKSSEFELSDKEFNYSLQKSRHNFDIGGLSVLDNVPDFTRSIKESSTSVNINRSLSDGCLPSASKKESNHLKQPKTICVSETSTPILKKDYLREVQQTPKCNEYIIKTCNVTPMIDYESMTSPERNKELEKYGLKPFKRKRAIQILTHLYNQTHPIVESCETEEYSSPSKKRKLDVEPIKQKSPQILIKQTQKPLKSPRKLFANSEGDVNKENLIYEVTKENPEVKELWCDPEDWVFQKREKAKVHSCKVPLHVAFHNYVSCRRLLREAILKYEPINIDVVHKDLVACGYRYNPKDLLKFMDKKCITVKTVDNNTRNRKS